MASIDAIAALNAKIVVAGHKSVGASDLAENLAASQQYLRDFTMVANRGGSVEELVPACSTYTANATNPTRCGSQPERKSLAGR